MAEGAAHGSGCIVFQDEVQVSSSSSILIIVIVL
jgi:hypothetical protein